MLKPFELCCLPAILRGGVTLSSTQVCNSPKNGRVLGKVSSGTQGTLVYLFVRLRPSFGAGEKTSEGGTVTMPLSDMFWGAYFGVCTDKYGINWMFNYAGFIATRFLPEDPPRNPRTETELRPWQQRREVQLDDRETASICRRMTRPVRCGLYATATYLARCCPVRVERAVTRSVGMPSNTTRPPSWLAHRVRRSHPSPPCGLPASAAVVRHRRAS